MNFASTSLIGLIGGFICIVVSILLNGNIMDFMDGPSVFIVFGGVLAATVASYPPKQLAIAIKVLKIAFDKERSDARQVIEELARLANIARREGLLALEEQLGEIHDPYFQKGISLIVDGSNAEMIKSVLETEIYYMSQRHDHAIRVFETMAGFAPAFGMIGTLIGLINMLVALDDPGNIGSAMATALITTFYGTMLANLVFSPIAKKLTQYSANEQLRKEMILEGILSIQYGENPRLIRDKLISFLSHSEVLQMEEAPDATRVEGDEQRSGEQ